MAASACRLSSDEVTPASRSAATRARIRVRSSEAPPTGARRHQAAAFAWWSISAPPRSEAMISGPSMVAAASASAFCQLARSTCSSGTRLSFWPGRSGSSVAKPSARQRAHREDEGAAGAVGFFEQRRDEQDRGARGAGGGDAEDMFGGGHCGAAQQREFIPVCPELVEGSSFCLSTCERTGRPFDKLRANG